MPISISEESCLFFNLHGDEFYIFILSGGGMVLFDYGVGERGRVLKNRTCQLNSNSGLTILVFVVRAGSPHPSEPQSIFLQMKVTGS